MKNSDIIHLIVKYALREDVGSRDITSAALVPKNLRIHAEIEFKEDGVLCGIEVAERVFRQVDENLRFLPTAKDGEAIEKGREIAYIEGSGLSILIAERTALNFLGRLSGIAAKTREFVEKVRGTPAKIMDTRKTTPNLRILEKYAVKCGGGTNHRFGLYDQALIKDNHLRILRKEPLTDIVARVKRAVLKNTPVGLEVKNLAEFREALKSRADILLLDNLPLEAVREAVTLRKKAGSRVLLEASGGIHLENVRAYAETGVDRISIGGLTHSAPWADVSLDIVA